MARGLARAVWVVGIVSFLTDLSSEMIYPLLPIFLTGVLGATTFELGVVEGIAEATASLLKVVSGFWADRTGKKRRLIIFGYSLSGLVRPIMGAAFSWPAVLCVRFADRIGKGIRTSPRDALISQVTPISMRGRAFGLHRAMDHAGAVCGPIVAGLLLSLPGWNLRAVFLSAAVPALATIAVLVLFLKEERSTAGEGANGSPGGGGGRMTPRELWAGWSALGPRFRAFLGAAFLFGLGNSADAFLLVRLSQEGVSAGGVAMLWSVHNGIKMTTTYLGGRVTDHVGAARTLQTGWLFYAVVYLLLGWIENRTALIAAFLAYGCYYGLVEPAERAWVAEQVPETDRGKAYGLFHFTVGIAALPASLVFGWFWQHVSPQAAFTLGAGLAFAACGWWWWSSRRVLNASRGSGRVA